MDTRLWGRVTVDKEIVCTVAGVRDTVFLYNLSAGGCMIELASGTAAIGDLVRVELGELDTARGEVVWQAERCLGIRFDAPIPDAIVRHLGFVPEAVAFGDQLPRNRVGRTLSVSDAGERLDPSSRPALF